MITNKTDRIQRNSISRDQAFDVYDALKGSVEGVEGVKNDTVRYLNGFDDNKIASATGVTDDAVRRIRIKRFGRLAEEMTSSSAKASARNSRIDALELKVERLINWVNHVEAEINKENLTNAAGKVKPVLFTLD